VCPSNDVTALYIHTSGGMEGIDPVCWWRCRRSWMAVLNEVKEKDAGKLRRGRMRDVSRYRGACVCILRGDEPCPGMLNACCVRGSFPATSSPVQT